MAHKASYLVTFGLIVAVSAVGCYSPYHTDRGALLGGLLGAGTGAVIGEALDNPGAGAAIGAGVGALTGAAVGQELDDMEARNRAMIEQQLGRQVAATAVTVDDAVTMTRAGVDDELIINHVRAHGVAAPLQASQLIYLQQQGVSTRVISAMQNPPARPARPVVVQERSPPVIVQEYRYGLPMWGPPRCRHHHWRHRPRPGLSWGVSVSN